VKNFRESHARPIERQPVGEIIGEVVTTEGLHRHRVATQHADRTARRGRGLGAHRRTDQHTMTPVARLEHEGQEMFPPPAEHDRRDRNPLRILGPRRPGPTVSRRDGEARIGVRGGPAARYVVTTLPILCRHARQSLPPGLVIGGECDVREQGVVIEHGERIGIGLRAGARRHAEITCFGVDRPEPTIGAGRHPADIVADRPDLPSGTSVTRRRDQHGQVGLATSRGECGGDVVRFPTWILDADDQHVLGEPAFLSRLPRSDAQRMALFAQQGIAPIARADRLDGELFREVQDVAFVGIEFTDRV
jgi:hypothetical protein